MAGFFLALYLRLPTHASQPAQPGGGPMSACDTGPQARIQKSGIPRRISQTRVGSPEGRNSPLWCSFLHFSQEKWRPPAGIPPGRCAPRLVKALTTRRVRSTAPFPRPGPGGNPRGRSGPAMVPTEPPTDGAAPQGGPRDRACRPHPRASERIPHSSTTSPVENWVTCSPNSSRSRANPLSPVQWPVRTWATPVSRRRRARARTSWSGVS